MDYCLDQIERTVSVPEMDDIISLAPNFREVVVVGELEENESSSVQEESNTQIDYDHIQTFLDSNNNIFQNI